MPIHSDPGPVSTGKPAMLVSLTGHLVPWYLKDDAPHLLAMPGTDAYYLPCFSSVEKMKETMTLVGITNYAIKLIDDGLEFVRSLPPRTESGRPLKVILDPYFTAERRVRFTEIMKN